MRLEEQVQQRQKRGGLGRDPGDTRDVHVAALATIDEVEVDIDRLFPSVEADGQRVFHLVHEERSGSLVTLDPADLLSRLGRHPAFGVGAQHPDLGTTHRLARHRLLVTRTVSLDQLAPSMSLCWPTTIP